MPPKTFSNQNNKNYRSNHDLVIVHCKNPYSATLKAVECLGGINQFVSPGSRVVIKPNISWDRIPEQAANTNPMVVAALVEMALKEKPAKVTVFDRTLNDPRRCYFRSGIAKAAKKAGAKVKFVSDRDFSLVQIKNSIVMNSCLINNDILKADCIINVPIAKHHGLAKLSMGMKNLMGVVGGNRGIFHQDINSYLVDLNKIVCPQLTILDAYRILLRHGPQGGLMEDVKLTYEIVAGADIVAVDSYGCSLFGIDPYEIGYIKLAHIAGLGEINIKKLKIKKINMQ
ncbi:MAG: DUF362 domain-containing protein [Thermodesulfobacteriota bacterium]|nr:DUF362 domain-containing protein [Thermodesulfobacteriota bacterium]